MTLLTAVLGRCKALLRGAFWSGKKCKLAGFNVFKVSICLAALLLLFIYHIGIYRNFTDSIICFDDAVENGYPDITDEAETPPAKGKSIFFHETSCNALSGYTITVKARQACAVESAAKLNPNHTVYLLYTSPIKYPNTTLPPTRSDRLIGELLKYKNIRIRRVDLKMYTKGTPLEKWYLTGELHRSTYANSHASDVLRYLSLWRYGGIYMDLDVVVMKNLDQLGMNFAGAESKDNVAAGVLNFDHQGFGHEVAEMCLGEISNNFRGYDWGFNGPGVITRVLKKICTTNHVWSMRKEKCKGFSVLQPEAFYPIRWQKWFVYFDTKKIKSAMDQVKKSYAIHVWNKFSFNHTILTQENDVAYGVIAKKYCPNVYRESGPYF